FPGPTHIHVAALLLNVLTDDVAAQSVSGTMTGLIGLNPHHWSPVQGLALCREPFLRDPETPGALPIWHPPGPADMEHAMPLLRPDLVILQALKSQLTFDPLAQLLVMVGELFRIPAFRRREGHPEDLELMTFPEPEQRPHPVIAPFLLSGPFPGDG